MVRITEGTHINTNLIYITTTLSKDKYRYLYRRSHENKPMDTILNHTASSSNKFITTCGWRLVTIHNNHYQVKIPTHCDRKPTIDLETQTSQRELQLNNITNQKHFEISVTQKKLECLSKVALCLITKGE